MVNNEYTSARIIVGRKLARNNLSHTGGLWPRDAEWVVRIPGAIIIRGHNACINDIVYELVVHGSRF